MVKKILSKLKSIAKKVSEIEPVYNEFGQCISCQGGRKECLHRNHVVNGRQTLCAVCGIIIK